jgi:molybdopterin-binding protein
LKISARNTLKGTIKSIAPDAINTEVTVEIAPGVVITAVITKASADSLELTEGKEVYTVIKSSDVMIAVDG